IGFEKLILKNKQLRLYFVSNPDSPYFESDTFKHLIEVLQFQVKNGRLKQVGTQFMVIIDGLHSIDDVLTLLELMTMKKVAPIVSTEENQLNTEA
ncbi:MAG: hypothetical protein KA198_10525, partial [Chitinophagaceae bacterium]|nr:hypothetical protein [Chitinophagaceae bacterium]